MIRCPDNQINAFCPGAPKRVPSDSEKHRRVYTSSNVCHSHEWRVDTASGLTLKKQNACLHAVRHAVGKKIACIHSLRSEGVKGFIFYSLIYILISDHNLVPWPPVSNPHVKTQSFKGTSLFFTSSSLWIQFTRVQKKPRWALLSFKDILLNSNLIPPNPRYYRRATWSSFQSLPSGTHPQFFISGTTCTVT